MKRNKPEDAVPCGIRARGRAGAPPHFCAMLSSEGIPAKLIAVQKTLGCSSHRSEVLSDRWYTDRLAETALNLTDEGYLLGSQTSS
jgi:hypothetical protein